jgi:hypothetical protein
MRMMRLGDERHVTDFGGFDLAAWLCWAAEGEWVVVYSITSSAQRWYYSTRKIRVLIGTEADKRGAAPELY